MHKSGLDRMVDLEAVVHENRHSFVARARQRADVRRVALKILSPASWEDQSLADWFRGEVALCAGPEELHQRGLIHRDVEPENIQRVRAANRVVLTDFGIARLARATAHDPVDRYESATAMREDLERHRPRSWIRGVFRRRWRARWGDDVAPLPRPPW